MYDGGFSRHDLEALSVRQAMIFLDKIEARKIEEMEEEYSQARMDLQVYRASQASGKEVKRFDSELEKMGYQFRELDLSGSYKPDKTAYALLEQAKKRSRG